MPTTKRPHEVKLIDIAPIGGSVLIGAAAIAAFGLLFAFPVEWLWNTLLPSIFGLRQISLLEAWGLLILCGLLFKGGNDQSNGKAAELLEQIANAQYRAVDALEKISVQLEEQTSDLGEKLDMVQVLITEWRERR